MKKLLTVFVLVFALILIKPVQADDDPSDLRKQIEEYTQKITELSKAKDTLSNQISYLNSQVELTQLKIQQTQQNIIQLEQEIQELSLEIDKLDINLNRLSIIFIQNVNQSYKLSKKTPPLIVLLTQKFNQFLDQYKYLKTTQQNNRDLLIQLETVRTNFDIQKTQKAQKQEELITLKNKLGQQQKDLNNQKLAKANLLEVTKNDEAKYQKLLAQARSELEAIEAIIAGKGVETEVGTIKEGDKIAYVIQGDSCSSSGTHLHFMVKKDNKAQNPFSFLSIIENINDSRGDPFNPSGSWSWPIKPIIRLTQGYGYTWAVQNTWVGKVYRFHTGIDIVSNTSSEVFATHDGTLYRGSYTYGCKLKYVRVENTQDNVETLYLHVNYF